VVALGRILSRPTKELADRRWGALINQAVHQVDMLLYLSAAVREGSATGSCGASQIESET